MSLGQINKKKPIHVNTGSEMRIVSQSILNTNQLPLISAIPVKSIDQGWHHQGL